jgi:PIN domain nuclease of toxin-antitoxin system
VVILDTHIAVWLLAGESRLTESVAYPYIEQASQRGSLRIASVSLFELSRLNGDGRLRLDLPLSDLFETLLNTPGLQIAELDPRVALESLSLEEFPGDETDRVICATARALRGSLVTADTEIVAYAKSGGLRVIPVQ